MKITTIHTGYFKLDGGAMFGVVPKRMWEKLNPPNDQNLCTWAMRSLLVEVDNRKILIDTGIGTKQDAKFRSHFEPTNSVLLHSLAAHGVAPEEITDVLLTHLHFDHVGGALDKDGLVFPEATYWSNQKHWNWAMQANEREKASFLKENFLPIQKENRLQFVDNEQDVRFCENINIHFTYGHTEAMMLPIIQVGEQTIVFCADTMPASYHIPMPYVMSYDIRPLQTLEDKAWLLEESVAKNWVLFFEHDPIAECGVVRHDERGRIVLDSVGKVADLINTKDF